MADKPHYPNEIAERLAPVPPGLIPKFIQQDEGEVNLFKAEYRAVQRLQHAEHVFIPEVVRTTHPPEAGPQGVAAHPAPSYVSTGSPAARPPSGKRAVGAANMGRPVSAAKRRSLGSFAGKHDWSERDMNTPGVDYVPLRPTPRGTPGGEPPWKLPPQRPTSALDASIKARVQSSQRPPPRAGTSQGLRPQSPGYDPHSHPSSHRRTGSPPHTAAHARRLSSAGSDPFIMDVDACDGLLWGNQLSSVPPSSRPASGTHQRAGAVEVLSNQVAMDTVGHIRATAGSVRTYSTPPHKSATSASATTYARKPQPAHHRQPLLPTPSERIACNFTPAARGLSPRLIEHFSPGGIRPDALGPVPGAAQHQHHQLALTEAASDPGEADGIVAAAKKHMAFLPLELFDNLDLETRLPEEWVALGAGHGGTKAETLLYNLHDDKYEWSPCHVLAWDAAQRAFEVQLATGKTKMVKRLNLRFLDEDPRRFQQRVADAKLSREEAEAHLRYIYYVNTLSAEEVLDTYNFDQALRNTVRGCCRLQSAAVRTQQEQLSVEAKEAYVRAMRQAILAYRRLDPYEEGRLQVLRLPPLPELKPTPHCGVLEACPDGSPRMYSFQRLCAWAPTQLYQSSPVMLGFLQTLQQLCLDMERQLLWCFAEQVPEFQSMDHPQGFTLEDAGDPPYTVGSFEALQHAHVAKVMHYINMKLLEALNAACDDDVLQFLHGGAPSAPHMESPLHAALLQCTALRATNSLHTLLLASAGSYCQYMEGYTVPEQHDGMYTGLEEVWNKPPLLIIQLADLGSRPVLVPSVEEILDVACGMFDEMAGKLGDIPDMFVRKGLTDGVRQLCSGTWAEDSQLQQYRQRVYSIVEKAVDRAVEIGSLFEAAADILAEPEEQVLARVESEDASLADYASLVGRFQSAALAVGRASHNEVHTGLVVVDCAPLKAALTAKANQRVHAVLHHLAAKCEATSLRVASRCAQMTERVALASADTREMLQLQADLDAYGDELKQLERMATANEERDAFLAAYRESLPDLHFQHGVAAAVAVRDLPETLHKALGQAAKEHVQFQRGLKLKSAELQAAVSAVQEEVAAYNRLTDTKEQLENADLGKKLQAKLAALEETAAEINEEEALFSWQATEYPLLASLKSELEPQATLWHITSEFSLAYDSWMFGSVRQLDPDEIESLNVDWFKKMNKLSKTLESPVLRQLAESMKERLEEFRTNIPIITCICNPGMRMRHWEALSAAASFTINPTADGCNLSDLLNKNNLRDYESRLQDISDVASREYALEKQLDKMQGEWSAMRFEVLTWKDTGGYILKGSVVEEAMMLLDDHTIKAQAMLSSPAAKPFIDRIVHWVKTLQNMQEIFDAWLKAQQMWMYLGPVYGSEEIAKHMPKERREFQVADSKWRSIMNGVVRNPDIISTTEQEGLLMDLQGCNKSFAVIEHSLNAFLETKKLAFPRFFFLSNDELLEILSETKDPLNVQPFVKKCFEAVRELEFQPDLTITAMISLEGERILLDTPIQAGGDHNGVERWLLALEGVMRKSLHTITRTAVQAYQARPREKWILEWPGQVVLAVGQVYWTSAVVAAISDGGNSALRRLAAQCTSELQQEVMLVRGELSALERCTLGALVVVDVHARDVVQEMVDDKVYTEADFSWQARLRYYWEKDDIVARMLNAQCTYGYEYLGNTGRLVITPLTDRCYRTLLGAHHMNLGGAPAGPAGTGKTETTKDLAKAVAIQCVVFNCSDGLDFVAMGKLFKGLAASGAWACFDEFNRIELEVLSVVAQQVLTIQRAKAAGKKRFLFEGTDLPLLPTCNVFITMNPGYAGRSELPDNLKALFRDVAMMVPDYAMIAEIILYSCGYLDARSLAQKLVQTYRLCSEQLSKQDHYDYGMRAVMAVLRAAGNLKRRYPDEKEDMLMLRAINDVNLPKFLDEDVPLFKGILSDLFPGVALPHVDYTDLTRALSANALKAGLQPLPAFIEKAIQLYEMIVVRHGLMLVGLSFGMKTASLRVLAGALGDLCAEGKGEFKVKVTTMNPKAVSLGQLYGQDDPVSKEWTDGVLAVAFRQAARDTSPDRKWLVLDGPVDAVWIENMNTVLDDNKKLCLNSGEIIAMQGLMNLIFEVADLAVASPATVSRCGMVYVQPSLLGWRPVVESWLASLPDRYTQQHKEVMLQMFDWLVPPTLRLVLKGCSMPVPVQDINMVQSLVRLYQALLDDCGPALEGNAALCLECLFIFACTWSLGGAVDGAGRQQFDEQLRNFLAGKFEGRFKAYATGTPRKLVRPLPSQATVYDWHFDTAAGGWSGWMDGTQGQQRISPEAEYSSIIVHTLDVARYTYLIRVLVDHHLPLLLVGPTGTGKTVYMKRHLAKLDRKAWLPVVFNFSAQTSANTTQDIVDGKLEKRRKGVYGPAVGRHAVVFVDDLNMPQVEKYGAQPPVELLRQYMDHGGWYDRQELTLRHIVDTQLLAAMGPPGGGRNPVTNRFLRHFHTLFVTEFGDESKTQIFNALVDWWFARSKVKEEIALYRDRLVAASLEVYSAAVQELLPTPQKTHYTFNLRDLSKVFQGMQEAGGNVADSNELVRLWVHEMMRVFHDRLVDDDDRSWLVEQLRTTAQQQFHCKLNKLLARVADEDGQVGVNEMRQLMFVEFMGGPGSLPRYEEVKSLDRLATVVEEQLADFNAGSKKPMRLVLFLYALEHVARICRILRQPAGHALLVGVGGSGRQSLTRLAAHILELQVIQIELSSTYSRSDWQDDLRRTLRTAGERGKPTIFLFSDSQIVEEAMVEDLSNLLNTAEVPNLFDIGEVISIAEGVRSKAKAAKVPDTRQDLYDFFVEQVRHNLHVVLAFSPVGEAFRERLRRFPSLTTATTIDWLTAWPDDALRSVASRALADLAVAPALKPGLAEQCMQFHRSVRQLTQRYRLEARRHFYVTPTSYLQLLDSFQAVLARRQHEMQSAQRRYEGGLAKLASTELQVKQMQAELEKLKPQLIVSRQETEKLMKVIERETREADKVKLVVQVDERKAAQEAGKVQAIKAECEADLAQAMPAYTAAIRSLDTLTKNDISEVKGMKNPPMPVKLVMEAVCLLKGLKPLRVKDKDSGQYVLDFWETSKKVLSDMYFLDSLKSYDKDNIAPEVIEAIKPYLSKPDFQPAKIKKVSQAAFGLCNWVRAMEQYDRVAKIVRPKKAALKEAEGQLATVMQALKEKQDQLAAVEAKLAVLGQQLDAAKARKEGLEAEVGLCEQKLERANKLIGGLGGEKARWSDVARTLGDQQERLVGDMLLAAGVVAYLGAFTVEYRKQAVEQWVAQIQEKGIPCSGGFTLVGALGDPVQLRSWNIWGLPQDDFSATNGIIVRESKCWPLCIDPQGQALKWITNMESQNNLAVLKPGESGYLRKLEAAIGLGRPVLLAGVGEVLDAALEPVLLQQTFKQGGVLCIKLGESLVTWAPGFRLYLTTKLRAPHYPPEVCTRVCLVNFMITPQGLQEQLLGITVAKERPDLEREKNELILQGAENKRKLKEIESRILEVLETSQGNILDDGAAVTVLQESKSLADDIARRQKEAERTEAAIDTARTGYQPVAHHAAALFFCMAELVSIDPMYTYSLAYFTQLFCRAIDDSPASPSLPKRLEALKTHFTHFLFTCICRSLFEKDQLLFAFSLANALARAAGHLEPHLLKFLLSGSTSMSAPSPNPAQSWLPDKGWADLCTLDPLATAFHNITADLAARPDAWQQHLAAADPPLQLLPAPYRDDLTPFQKLLVLRCVAPDKLIPAIQAYVVSELGQRYVEPQPLQLGAAFADSTADVPLICVLSQGSDPMAELLKFADEKHRQVETVSLGQGQGPAAERCIHEAAKAGYWVVLQNCHLAASFLPRLELLCEEVLQAPTTHSKFRLWLTSYPTGIFPISVLEGSLKMTYELPAGLSAGMARAYRGDPLADKGFLEGCAQEGAFKCLAYALAFFHCVVTGRRQYGAVGWNIAYAFNENDLRISMRQLRLFLDTYDDVPLALLRYTAGECNYGGKVTDAQDRRTLATLLASFYTDASLLPGSSLAPGAAYAIPKIGNHASYLQHMAALPLSDSPEVFGLHPNAAISKDLQATRTLLDSLLLTIPQTAAAPPAPAASPTPPSGPTSAHACPSASGAAPAAADSSQPSSEHTDRAASSEPTADDPASTTSTASNAAAAAAAAAAASTAAAAAEAGEAAASDESPSPETGASGPIPTQEDSSAAPAAKAKPPDEAAQPSAAGSQPPAGPVTTEDTIFSIASEILDQLPPDFNLESAGEKYPVVYLESMNTVLVQELGRVNALLRVIRSSLQDVRLAVRGRVVMSADLERVAAALLNGKVPEMWLAKSFPSLKPLGPYCAELLQRTAFFSRWLQEGAPALFWLPAFFFTQAFLTGVKQNYARRHRIPIDLIDFTFSVLDDPAGAAASQAPADGVHVTGMFLEAASWDAAAHQLAESKPKLLHVPMPPMHFLPAEVPPAAASEGRLRASVSGGEDGGWYLCPLYKTSERRGVLSTTGHSTNYVMGVRLPTAVPAGHWVKRGTALLTSLD